RVPWHESRILAVVRTFRTPRAARAARAMPAFRAGRRRDCERRGGRVALGRDDRPAWRTVRVPGGVAPFGDPARQAAAGSRPGVSTNQESHPMNRSLSMSAIAIAIAIASASSVAIGAEVEL